MFVFQDEEFTTTVFVYINNMIWKYLGRYRAHYKPIKDIAFGIDVDLNQPRLLTLGQDRILVRFRKLSFAMFFDLALHSCNG